MNNIWAQTKAVISKVFAETVKEVEKDFPTDDDCVDEIYRLVEPNLQCGHCDEVTFSHNHGSRIASCDTCSKKIRFTAGTLFDHMHKPRPILTALIAMKNGVIFNPNMLSNACGVVYQSAYGVFDKLTRYAIEMVEQDSIPVLSNEFDKVISRRSFETEARRHPHTEKEKEFAQMMERGEDFVQERIRQYINPDGSLAEGEEPPIYADEQRIYDMLADGAFTANTIAELSGMNIAKVTGGLMLLLSCELIAMQPGGYFKRTPIMGDAVAAFDPNTMDRVTHAVDLLRIVFRGVSRRYIQRYVAAYWCFVGRSQAERDSFVQRCCMIVGGAKEFSDSYVSPIILSFPARFSQDASVYCKFGLDNV